MPRTQTNDQPGPPYRGIQRLTALTLTSSGQIIWANGNAVTTIVVVTMDVVSDISGTSTDIAIGIAPGGGSSTFRVFGAATGAGQFDTFSWRGYLPLLYNDELVAINVSGSWDFTAAGYAIPTPGVP